MFLGVTLTETRLAPATGYSVTLNGMTQSSTSGRVTFLLVNHAAYAFTVGAVRGYPASALSGSGTVNNAPANVPLTFTPIATLHAVIFSESGLALGTLWSVTPGGSTNLSTTSNIVYWLPAGPYTYSRGTMEGDTKSATPGSPSRCPLRAPWR